MKPSLVAFNIIIDACGKAGRDEEAVQSYVDLIECRYRPNAVTYTSLISAVAEAGRYEKADELYRRMLHDRVEPTGHTYATMIHACARRGWTRYGHEVAILLHFYNEILLLTPLVMQLMQSFVVRNEYNSGPLLRSESNLMVQEGCSYLKTLSSDCLFEIPLSAFSRYAWRLLKARSVELSMGQCFICTSKVDGIPMQHQF
jgi:pentatricopeptide repeat protein